MSPADEPYRVLVVCTGNICRSPMAEVVLTERFDEEGLTPQVRVDSAGISDEEHGNPIDPRAQRELRDRDYPVPHHRARPVTSQDARRYDLFLAMTAQHARGLRRLGVEEDRIRLYRSYPPDGSGEDVPDPWYGDASGFTRCLDTIEEIAPSIVQQVGEGLRQVR
ncbi:low molecular weight protein-tyrosine-phosphatase [Ruania albidiflava]|uniref:low molecular weight protein-tyrosine-phosphatase n=2 Tax=Ruania albidiflava TaxID=366586 RepID=UPI0003B4032E|nr:low molecular weight protein-tyrosine-phosphatase [Ruania albidiflava]